MIKVDLEIDELKNKKNENFGSLEEYVASLNLNEEVNSFFRLWNCSQILVQEIDKGGMACNSSLDFALGGNWKEEVNKNCLLTHH